MSDLREFAEHNWGGLSGRIPIILLDAKGQPNNHKFFVWPEQSEDLFEYAESKNAAGLDVYTTTATFRSNRAQKVVTKDLQVVHADDDGFTAGGGEYLLAPSMTVHTSPGHAHQYWLIEDCTDPNIIEPLAHSVATTHDKSEGVDKCWAMNHLYRVPGSTNTAYSTPGHKKYIKGAQPFVSVVVFSGATYTLEEFSAAYPAVETAQIAQTERGELPSYSQALASLPSSATLDDLLDKGYSKEHLDRSNALHLLQQEVFRLGGTNEVAFVLCENSPINKFASQHNGSEKLWIDVLRGRSKAGSIIVEDEPNEDIVVTVAPTKKEKEYDFLTDAEKNSLPATFVDEYVAWAASKTDAASKFHIASAFTILSTLFSDYGHAFPKYGRLPLNMWFMVLGDTTRSRKSTTRAQMLAFVRAMQDQEGMYLYDLGSDTTPEALDNALLDRPNRSSLFHRDEAQDWFAEMDSKAYMGGAKGKFTEIYDGHVSGKLRATGENKRRAAVDVSMSLYLMGIRSQVSDYLTQGDFQSGFLTRFVYVEADPPERTEYTDWLEQGNPDEVREGDTVFSDLLDKLKVGRDHWDSFVPVEGPTIPVLCSPEAWRRMNKFITDVLDAAEGHSRHAIIEASSQRLVNSIIKAATLLAMYECCEEVQMSHMLAALNYASAWFSDMVSMANRVSESAWARRQDEVVDHLIAAGGESKWSTTFNKFRSEMKPREFQEIVQALDEAGRLQTRWVGSEGKSRTRYIELLMEEAA